MANKFKSTSKSSISVQDSEYSEVRLYMFLRLLMLYSVLVSAVFFQKSKILPESVFFNAYSITFLTFLLTTVFILLYEKAKTIKYFLASQIIYDIFFTTSLIFYTGPYDSIYIIFYFLNVLFAAFLFHSRGALLAALFSGALFVLLVWIHSDSIFPEKRLSILTILTALIAMALLSGQLIEELQKTRKHVSALEGLGEEIVERLDSGLIGLDTNDSVIKMNKTTQNLLGIPSAEIFYGKKLREVLPYLGDYKKSGIREIVIQGKKSRILLNHVALPENQSMILLKDLSSILELEDQVRLNEHLAVIGRLVTGIAHEIRNPVASLSGAAQLLLSKPTLDSVAFTSCKSSGEESERERDVDATKNKETLLKIILRETERVDRLVSQLLQFSRPIVLKKEQINLTKIVQECIETIRTREDYQSLKIEVFNKIKNPLITQGSSDQLYEVFTNLLVNALQAFSEELGKNKKPTITIEGEKTSGYIKIVVSDNGPGIAPEHKIRAFEPFFTTKPQGVGLGLAQVHKIIREHFGKIELESSIGHGACFKIFLPA